MVREGFTPGFGRSSIPCMKRMKLKVSSRIAGFLLFFMMLPAGIAGASIRLEPVISPSARIEEVDLLEGVPATKEVPLAMIDLIRSLHEKGRFDWLVLPASAMDVWLAMDVLLKRSGGRSDPGYRTNAVRLAGGRAWSDEHQYPEAASLFGVIHDSLSSKSPLYVSGSGMNLGSATVWKHGDDIIKALVFSLTQYAALPMSEALVKKYSPLLGLARCQVAHQKEIEGAIRDLEKWIQSVGPRIHDRYPGVPHAEALALIPSALQENLDRCTGMAADAEGPIKRIREGAKKPKIMVWEDSFEARGSAVWKKYRIAFFSVKQKSKPADGIDQAVILKKTTAPEFQIPTP